MTRGIVAAFALIVVLATPARAGDLADLPMTVGAPAAQSQTPSADESTAPSGSSSPGAAGRPGGIATGAGLIVLAVIVAGLLVMRNRLLRR